MCVSQKAQTFIKKKSQFFFREKEREGEGDLPAHKYIPDKRDPTHDAVPVPVLKYTTNSPKKIPKV